MFVTDHAIHGGLALAVPATLLGAPEAVTWSLFAVGAIWNALPDIVPVHIGVGAYVNFYAWYDWPTYSRWHTGTYRHVAPLHTWVDTPMHKPDGHWWPREWRTAVVYWALEITAMWWFLCLN